MRLRLPASARPTATRLLQACAIAAIALVSLGASSPDTPSARYNNLGHQMMCVCSCAQILAECNHVGCPDSSEMLALLRTSIASGSSDRSILEAFQAKYGPTALAAPMLTNFNKIAWIVPPAVLAFGLIGAILLIRRWRLARTDAPHRLPNARLSLSPQQLATRDRIRHETEL